MRLASSHSFVAVIGLLVALGVASGARADPDAASVARESTPPPPRAPSPPPLPRDTTDVSVALGAAFSLQGTFADASGVGGRVGTLDVAIVHRFGEHGVVRFALEPLALVRRFETRAPFGRATVLGGGARRCRAAPPRRYRLGGAIHDRRRGAGRRT